MSRFTDTSNLILGDSPHTVAGVLFNGYLSE